MVAQVAKIVRLAVRSWPETFRFCLIVVVVAAASTIFLYFAKVPALSIFMK